MTPNSKYIIDDGFKKLVLHAIISIYYPPTYSRKIWTIMLAKVYNQELYFLSVSINSNV